MSSPTAPPLGEQIITFVRTQLGVEDAVTADTPLVTDGLIDSVGLMRLAAFIEQTTGLTIPDQDINPGHFDTVRQIEAYLRGRGAA
jgi:acyl carrier protein